MINIRNTGKTLVLGTQGTKIASAGLKGRVFEASSADLRKDEVAFRKFKLVPKDVQGKNCLTHFHGLDRACDEICSMVKKKRQTAIEAHVAGKITEGYLLHPFCVGFSKNPNVWVRKGPGLSVDTSTKSRRWWESRPRGAGKCLQWSVSRLQRPFGKDTKKPRQSIDVPQDVLVRKIKMLKKPKSDLGKLMLLLGEGSTSGRAAGGETR